MFDLITIGDSTLDTYIIIDDATVNCDLKNHTCRLCLNYADKIPIRDTAQSVGGNAANVAVGAKKLGLKTALVTELGDDITGHIIFGEMEMAGIDTRWIKILKNHETRYSTVLNFKSERTILSYYAKRNYSLPNLSPCKWIYYSSLGKTFENTQKKLIKFLEKNPETKLIFNPGSYQIKNLEEIKKIIPLTYLLFVNKEEAQKIFGKNKNIKKLIKAGHQAKIKIMVITDGENGSYASDGNKIYFMPPYPIKPIAKTGAGDAYSSGFISAMSYGKDLIESMLWGTANAGGVIQEFGAQKGLLTVKKIYQTIKQFPNNQPKII